MQRSNDIIKRTVKQVIVLRHDLKCRTGKLVVQGAHASIGAFYSAEPEKIRHWRLDGMTKVCVYVTDEQALLDLYKKVKRTGLPIYLVEDAGVTEFHGKLTHTALAIGPDNSDWIDEFTKDLPLM